MPSSTVRNKFALIILGTAIWAITMIKSGLPSLYGLGFWGANGHDGIWHLSLINGLAKGSLAMPMFAGENIRNYHIGFDVLVASLSRLLPVSSTFIYFQLLPPLFAFLIGWLTYGLVYTWKKSSSAAWWSTFFVYFGGSLGWLFGKGESLFWAQQSISTLINPPFALSLILLLAGAYCLYKNSPVGTIILLGLLSQIKIYAAVLAISGLILVSIFYRKNFWTLLGTVIFSLLLFLPLNSQATSLMLVQPGWFLETLFAPDRLNFSRFFSALNTYRTGQNWAKAFLAYSLALAIFLIGNLSTRIASVGLVLNWFKHKKIPDLLTIFFLGIFIVGLVLPLLFIQTGTSWNTIQFFYYSQIVASIFAGIAVSQFLATSIPKLGKLVFALAVILLTLPSTLNSLQNYLPSRPPAMLSFDELQALEFTSRLPVGVILTYPFDKDLADAAIPFPPRPLYLYESTAYVSAFSHQPVYLEDQVNLNITDFPWQSRRNQALAFFAHPTVNFIKDNHIRYLYLVGSQRSLISKISHTKNVFSNQTVTVLAVIP